MLRVCCPRLLGEWGAIILAAAEAADVFFELSRIQVLLDANFTS